MTLKFHLKKKKLQALSDYPIIVLKKSFVIFRRQGYEKQYAKRLLDKKYSTNRGTEHKNFSVAWRDLLSNVIFRLNKINC